MRPHYTSVGEIKKTNTLSATEETSAYEIALELLETSFQGMPIVNSQNQVVGKVSEIQLLKALSEGKDLEKTEAGEIMELCPPCIRETTPLEEAVSLMVQEHLLRIPVVDDHHRLIWTVTRHDVLRAWMGVWLPEERGGHVEVFA